MTVTWTDAIVFAFAWSCIWGSLLVSHVLDWKFEWMQPKLWFLYVKRNLSHSKEIFFKCSELPNKIHKPFEDLINVFETGIFSHRICEWISPFAENLSTRSIC